MLTLEGSAPIIILGAPELAALPQVVLLRLVTFLRARAQGQIIWHCDAGQVKKVQISEFVAVNGEPVRDVLDTRSSQA